jgi:RNA polymerase sigma factor (sigma-70 family)
VTSSGAVEHFFRRDYGRLVSTLARRVGFRHIEVVEDAVQCALMAALTAWTKQSLPADPGAWLYKAAYNQLIQALRRESRRLNIRHNAAEELGERIDDAVSARFADEIRDDMLRMLFVCCDESIPRESQLVLALKILCGFSTSEIALRLFTSEGNIHKRLGRARVRLREIAPGLDAPPLDELRPRLPGVHAVLYLLFNEGYLSAHSEQAIRRELCDEAVRLATLLGEHRVSDNAGDLRAARAYASARSQAGGARRWRGRSVAAGRAGSVVVGSRRNRDRNRMVATVGRGRDIFAFSCGGGHCGGALSGGFVCADPMERDRGFVRHARSPLPFTLTHLEQGSGSGPIARTGSRTRSGRRTRAARLVGRLVSMGRCAGRPASARRT